MQWRVCSVVIVAVATVGCGRVQQKAKTSVQDSPKQSQGLPQDLARAVPVELRVQFQDTTIEKQGGKQVHHGNATYVFSNDTGVTVKLIFPPIGFFFDPATPLTPKCNDVAGMPEFCRDRKTIVLKPGARQKFQSPYMLETWGEGPSLHRVRFIFGPAVDPKEPNVLIDEISCNFVLDGETKKGH